MEKALEQSGNQLILQAFGSKDFEKLYWDDHNWIPTEAIDVCRGFLGQAQSKANPELRFHIHMKLASYYAKDNQPKAAIHTLHEALSIKSINLIANHRIAVLYESIGSGEDASAHYRRAAKDGSVSKNMKEYLENQIRRIMTEGPRQPGPYDYSGFKWLT